MISRHALAKQINKTLEKMTKNKTQESFFSEPAYVKKKADRKMLVFTMVKFLNVISSSIIDAAY